MKIALLFDHFGPYHLARLGAAAKLNEVTGIEFAGKSADYAWDVGERPEAPLRSLSAPDEQIPSAEFDSRLVRALEETRPDAVAIPGWSGKGALAALHWCLRSGTPSILMSESCAHDETRRWWKEALKRRLVRGFSAALVGGTAHAAYAVRLGMPRERVFLGYDAVDNAHFTPPPDSTQVRAGFLASARFIEKKNLPRLLEAYASYRHGAHQSNARAWPLTLLGDGPLRGDLDQLLSNLGLTDSVTMPGFMQYGALPGYYAAAAAFIHASTTEQWGLVVNEAMAAGLPVLVSDRCGCAPDLVRPGVNGFTFDPGDTRAIADAMGKIAALDPRRLSDMGASSRAFIAEWGPARFASGLDAAATAAMAAGARRADLTTLALLPLLTR